MNLCKVIGEYTSDMKIDDYKGLKMLIVQPIKPDGTFTGKPMFGVDNCQAGVGDTVLVMDEGGSARMLLEEPEIFTIRTVVCGIVDEISVAGE